MLPALGLVGAAAGARWAFAAPQAAEHESAVQNLLELIAIGIEVIGVGVIVAGALLSIALLLADQRRSGSWVDAYEGFRANLGRGILLGLEFLVAADIIGTVAVQPSFESLGVLAMIIVIRTFLSFSLEVEIKGHWPWRDSAHRMAQRANAGDS